MTSRQSDLTKSWGLLIIGIAAIILVLTMKPEIQSGNKLIFNVGVGDTISVHGPAQLSASGQSHFVVRLPNGDQIESRLMFVEHDVTGKYIYALETLESPVEGDIYVVEGSFSVQLTAVDDSISVRKSISPGNAVFSIFAATIIGLVAWGIIVLLILDFCR